MKVLGRTFPSVGFIVWLAAATWACGSRNVPAGGSVPAQPAQPPEIPSPASAKPEPAPLPLPPPPSPPAPAVSLAETATAGCALVDEPGEPVATVALGDRIDPSNAPHPSNESERLLFRQVYETLIRVDCEGQVRPGLAATWRRGENERTWIVSLRENARFSDGTPVTPADVRAGWIGNAGELRPHVSRLIESIAAVDERSLAITLRSRRTDVPLALAHTDLAVVKRSADSPWPLGTRTAGAAERAAAVVMTDSAILVQRESLPPIRFVVASSDPRDLLDAGVDLMLTRDSAALTYAQTLPHLQSMPLEWHRIHVLLTPGRSRGAPSLPESARQALAGDAVRGEARGAAGPFWWQMLEDCDVGPPPPPALSTAGPRIVYDARDGVARDLAERFVGLARTSGPAAAAILDVLLPDRTRRASARAIGLTGEPLARARRLGTDAAYIMSLDRRPLDPCRDTQVVIDGVPWLDPETIVPLVETRMRAIVRRGKAGVTAEWDGGLLLEPGGLKSR